MNRSTFITLPLCFAMLAACATSGTVGYPDAGKTDSGLLDSGVPPKDGSTADSTTDTSVPLDDSGTPVCKGTGLSGCTPQSVCAFSPASWPLPKVTPGACTSLDVTNFFDWCISPGDTTNCTNFSSTKSACQACLITPDTSAKYGALVQDSNDLIKNNIAGCFAVKGDTTCNGAVSADTECTQSACPDTVCPVPTGDATALTALNKCITDSDKTNCASYAKAAAPCLTGSVCGGATFRDAYISVATAICVTGN